jgi:hypothetical protein
MGDMKEECEEKGGDFRTSDGGKAAPLPDMTDAELEDFERWEWDSFGVTPTHQWGRWSDNARALAKIRQERTTVAFVTVVVAIVLMAAALVVMMLWG